MLYELYRHGIGVTHPVLRTAAPVADEDAMENLRLRKFTVIIQICNVNALHTSHCNTFSRYSQSLTDASRSVFNFD